MHYRRLRRGLSLSAPKRGDHFTPVKYHQAHVRVKALWGKASQYPCITCGGTAAEWAYDGTDTPGHSIHPEFYAPKCVRCHRAADLGGRRLNCFCGKQVHGKGLCNTHYKARWRYHRS